MDNACSQFSHCHCLCCNSGPLLQLALEMASWTAVNTIFLVGSLLMYFVMTFTMYSNGSFLMFPSAFNFIGEWGSVGLISD